MLRWRFSSPRLFNIVNFRDFWHEIKLLETNIALKINGWKMNILLGPGLFSETFAVSSGSLMTSFSAFYCALSTFLMDLQVDWFDSEDEDHNMETKGCTTSQQQVLMNVEVANILKVECRFSWPKLFLVKICSLNFFPEEKDVRSGFGCKLFDRSKAWDPFWFCCFLLVEKHPPQKKLHAKKSLDLFLCLRILR